MKFRSLLKVSNLLKILSLIIFLGLSYTILGQVDDPRVDGIPPGMYDNLPPTIQSPMAPVTVGDYDNFNIGTDFAECHISANPNNPLQFFCAYNINGPHYTQNGYDWASTVPSFGSTPRGDPTTAYDGAGNLYYENMYGSISGTKLSNLQIMDKPGSRGFTETQAEIKTGWLQFRLEVLTLITSIQS